MNVRIDDKYTITTDAHKLNYIVSEIGIIGSSPDWFTIKAKKENIGKEKYIPLGFFQSFERAIQYIADRKLKESDVKSIAEVITEIKKLRRWIEEQMSLQNI